MMSEHRLWVASDGTYKQTVIDTSHIHPSISYLERQNRTQIADRIANTDYCLMHGLFIETFGLNSLECLQAGVPVIGYSQGGTKQFLLPHTTLDTYTGETQADRLYTCLYTIITANLTKDQYTSACLAIASRYTADKWYETIQSSLG